MAADDPVFRRARERLADLAEPEAIAVRAVFEAFAAEEPGTRAGVRAALAQEVRAEAAARGLACGPESPRDRRWPRWQSAERALHDVAVHALGTFRDLSASRRHPLDAYLPGDPLDSLDSGFTVGLAGAAMAVVRRRAAALAAAPVSPKSAAFGA